MSEAQDEMPVRPRATGERRLPGDPGVDEMIARMIRVDQAGEYGARRIYEGQLAVLGRSPQADVIRGMAEAEARHLDEINRLMVERRVRPTLLSPVWHVAGFALGAASAMMGARAAMACTVAVEEVIEGHYARQANQLGDDEAKLRDKLEAYGVDEAHHRETAIANDAELAPGYQPLTRAIKAGTRLAIWLSERL